MKRVFYRFIDLFFQVTFPKLALNFRIKRFLKKRYKEVDSNGIPFKDDVNNNMKTFLSGAELNDVELVERIKKDMVRKYLLYGITPDEYFLHNCRQESEDYLKTILSRCYKQGICRLTAIKHLQSDNKIASELTDKWRFYQLAKPYFKRDVCRVDKNTSLSEVEEFCGKHNRFIVKPRLASCGIGVHIVDLQKVEGGIVELMNHYINLDGGQWLFEELIVQDPIMAAWHESSVNTIRVPSIRTRNGCKILLPLFRTGKNGNIVDNCHNDGGLMAVPDAQTGILVSDGYDVFTNVIEKHPNSGIVFKGWQVPRWEELVKTAAALHESLPKHHKYVGFDFALTSKGWTVVEGNWGNFPHQVCVHHGIRQEFEKLMKS